MNTSESDFRRSLWGEEFVAILSIRRCRKRSGLRNGCAWRLPTAGSVGELEMQITASFASLEVDQTKRKRKLMEKADAAMYAAKERRGEIAASITTERHVICLFQSNNRRFPMASQVTEPRTSGVIETEATLPLAPANQRPKNPPQATVDSSCNCGT